MDLHLPETRQNTLLQGLSRMRSGTYKTAYPQMMTAQKYSAQKFIFSEFMCMFAA